MICIFCDEKVEEETQDELTALCLECKKAKDKEELDEYGN